MEYNFIPNFVSISRLFCLGRGTTGIFKNADTCFGTRANMILKQLFGNKSSYA